MVDDTADYKKQVKSLLDKLSAKDLQELEQEVRAAKAQKSIPATTKNQIKTSIHNHVVGILEAISKLQNYPEYPSDLQDAIETELNYLQLDKYWDSAKNPPTKKPRVTGGKPGRPKDK